MSSPLPSATRWAIVGAGFAGAATAWALARRGLGPGLILEQEATWGAHASGKNAALAKIAEGDELICRLAMRSLRTLQAFDGGTGELVRSTGGLTLAHAELAQELEAQRDTLRRGGLPGVMMTSAEVGASFPPLAGLDFDVGLWCPVEGVVDVHALLTRYLQEAKSSGFRLHTSTAVRDLLVEGGRVVGVATDRGDVRAELVVDASGAWAGRLGRGASPLPFRALRRHLFVSDRIGADLTRLPFTWVEDAGFYFRPEGDGLLLSPCDETPSEPCSPSTDLAAAELLAEKLARHAPAFADLAIRRAWACLRTFAPDRRPAIGFDAERPGLFHVAALGGFGMTTSAAVGELAAALIAGSVVDWIDADDVAPGRLTARV